ncbi:MAG TPA: ferredoxin [Actinomycetales bacterium]|nr:ferredoxin [Actinomycetales bacterium]
MSERLHVDWTACDARGTCLDLLPELLEADDWGYPLARTGEAAPAVPPSSRDYAVQAVRECPRMALRLRPG